MAAGMRNTEPERLNEARERALSQLGTFLESALPIIDLSDDGDGTVVAEAASPAERADQGERAERAARLADPTKPRPVEPTWVTVAEAADAAGVDSGQVRQWYRSGLVPTLRSRDGGAYLVPLEAVLVFGGRADRIDNATLDGAYWAEEADAARRERDEAVAELQRLRAQLDAWASEEAERGAEVAILASVPDDGDGGLDDPADAPGHGYGPVRALADRPAPSPEEWEQDQGPELGAGTDGMEVPAADDTAGDGSGGGTGALPRGRTIYDPTPLVYGTDAGFRFGHHEDDVVPVDPPRSRRRP